MNLNKVICPNCSREITTNNISRHSIACLGAVVKSTVPKINLRNTGKVGKNQFTKAALEGRMIPTMSDASKAKSLATKVKNGTLAHTAASKRKLSETMKRVAIERPESYSSSNRGRTKQIIVDGIKLQGQWEVDFYLWAKEKGLDPKRPTKGFSYNWHGTRTYYPDFYIPPLDMYVEVKGYETDKDQAKWSQFPKKLCIIKEAEIKQIRKGCFIGL
jgi:hypothetical protein